MNRRGFVAAAATGLASALFVPGRAGGSEGSIRTRAIPSSGRQVPLVGMGTWITFNVGANQTLRDARTDVLRRFFALGGGLIDSSPMYGSSEAVIGYGLDRLSHPQGLFSATKVWTGGRADGIAQMQHSQDLWNAGNFDLMQIHNMLDWETHFETLQAWKAEGRIGHTGITTSHGRRHGDLEKAIASQPFDCVQLTYNIVDRQAENRLLPLAAERGIAVIVNRPFQGGHLVDRLRGYKLPEWAPEIGCSTWAQFLLKFILSHPAVTCAIPATTQVAHMSENMDAAFGMLPDQDIRARMIAHVANL